LPKRRARRGCPDATEIGRARDDRSFCPAGSAQGPGAGGVPRAVGVGADRQCGGQAVGPVPVLAPSSALCGRRAVRRRGGRCLHARELRLGIGLAIRNGSTSASILGPSLPVWRDGFPMAATGRRSSRTIPRACSDFAEPVPRADGPAACPAGQPRRSFR
jgi:hypothetical protein